MKFEYWKGLEWNWHLKATNGEIVACGEGYKRKADMLHAIALVKSSTGADIVALKRS